ncbi:MAG: hypothetical protein HY856_06790 [Burkholderiales bacterium]|nr:hypothetical protein [Burkholderiales bacterium]
MGVPSSTASGGAGPRGGPLQVPRAADDETPRRLVAQGHAVPGDRPYAPVMGDR